MPMAQIPFSQYAPDAMPLDGGAGTAKNVYPHAKISGEGFEGTIYKQFNTFVADSDALTAYCRGGLSAVDTSGNVYTFAGDGTTLYRRVSSAMNDVSKAGGYALSSDHRWDFAQFGGQVIATSINEAPQEYTLGSSSLFADLGGSPPQAYTVAGLFRFIALGNLSGAPTDVRWSQIDDATTWTISAANQSGSFTLPEEGGWVNKIHPLGQGGIVLQERMIHTMDYIGGGAIFRVNMVESARGSIAQHGSILVGRRLFYIGDDGFYMWSGGESVPIGNDRVDQTFADDLDSAYVDRISIAADPIKKIVLFGYPGSGNSSGNINNIFVYNWSIDRWAKIEGVDLQFLFRSMSVGYTLDELDAAFGTDIDDTAVYVHSFDSRFYTGGVLSLSAFDANNKMGNFTGTAMDAVIDTPEKRLVPFRRAQVNSIRPLVDGGTHTVQVGSRNTQAGSNSFGSAITQNSYGDHPTTVNALYHRFRCNITGDFNQASGVQVEFEDVGEI